MIVALANPVSGQGLARERLRHVEQVCRGLGKELRVLRTMSPGDVVRQAREAARMRPEAVCVVGGDGSVGELCRAYADLEPEMRPPIVLVPAGRGNSFYKAILSDAPWEEYVRRALARPHVRPVDAARIDETGDVWVLGFSLGYFADCVDATRYFKGLRGRTLYAAAGIFCALRLRPFEVTVEVDGSTVFAGRSVLVGVAGGPFRGGRLLLYPTTDLTDGLLDVVIVRDVPSARFFEILRLAGTGKHTTEPDVHVFKGAQVRISAPEMRAELDGTPFPAPGPQVTSTCLPGLLPVAFPLWDWEDVPRETAASGSA